MMSTAAKRLIGLLYISQTVFVGSTFGTFWPVFVAAILVTAIVAIRLRGDASPPSRSRFIKWLTRISLFILFAAMIVATSAWRIGTQISESINVIYVGTDTLAHVILFAGLIVWTLRPRSGHKSMLPLGLVVVLLCVAGGGTSLSLAAQTTVALATCVGFTLASQAILGAERGGGTLFARDPSASQKTAWVGPIVSMLTLSLLLMVTSAIASGANLVLPGIQKLLQEQLESTIDASEGESIIGGTRYVRGSQLGVIRRHMLGDPEQIALRVHSDITPGYLRGYAFDVYQSRRWMSAADLQFAQFQQTSALRDRVLAPSARGRIELEEPGSNPLQRFSLTRNTNEETIQLEIHNDPLKGLMVFTPMTTRWVEAYSRELVVTKDGIVRLGVDVTHPYVAGVGTSVLREELDPLRREILLQVPPYVAAQTEQIASQVAGPLRSAPEKAAAISSFFQSEFSYSMAGTRAPRRVDPLSFFLQTRHEAHCEYFASATVLILRSAGVPARYVTGYVADEYDKETENWVARNRDAHAWAEAYDEETRKWFAVESTPGRRYRTVDPDEEAVNQPGFFDAFRGDDDGSDNDTLLSWIVGWLLSIRATDPLLVLFRLAQLPLFCVLVFLIWSKYLRPAREGIDPIDTQSRKMLKVADRRAGKHALVRGRSETLYQFADRIDACRGDAGAVVREIDRERLAILSCWYRSYADARYRGRLPVPIAS